MWETVCMGFIDPVSQKRFHGAILADEMGLGKSIQAIALIWTALKQGPSGEPIARKAVVVCPSSLVGNWAKEIDKWLKGRLQCVQMGESSKTALGKLSEFQFKDGLDVLIISYDQLKIHCKEIAKVHNIDLVICDEGHRLKNTEIKTSQSVKLIKAPRRVILSGTPIQNDLSEFYAMVDYVNPGILGSVKQFKNVYEEPVMKSREVDATPEQKEIGSRRSKELTQKTERFILRRTQVLNRQYLPAKVEYTVFCNLTPLQSKLYVFMCTLFNERHDKKEEKSVEALPLITNLKKLCNSPELIYQICQNGSESLPVHKLLEFFSEDFSTGKCQPELSGKLLYLDKLLGQIRQLPTRDKIVIVSNYTETLSLLADLCKQRGYPYFQLDGKTAVKKRQQLVDLFNVPTGKEVVFLLSSKAGGVGLNLIGANHLVLFDPDWNPANDEQAMARVWRSGQQKVCHLYRVLSTGTIEEKVYQRQITKMALSKSVVEGDTDSVPQFTTSELRDIFKYKPETLCDTHDLLNCRCALALQNQIKIPRHQRMAVQVDDLLYWEHIPNVDVCTKYPLLQTIGRQTLSLVFAKETPKELVEESKEDTSNQNKTASLKQAPLKPVATTTATTTTTTTTSKSEDEQEEEEEIEVVVVDEPKENKRKTTKTSSTRETKKKKVIAISDEDSEDDGGPDVGYDEDEDSDYDD